MNNISKHISYTEATSSNTAIRNKINNTPTAIELENMKLLAEKVFEPLRTFIKLPIKINSFFRSKQLNKAVGGSTTSHHCKGMAIDISIPGKNSKMFDYIRSNLKFTQLIWEYGNGNEPDWIHISYDKNDLKNEILVAYHSGKKTLYKPFIKIL